VCALAVELWVLIQHVGALLQQDATEEAARRDKAILRAD